MVERLGVKRESLDWELIPQYKGFVYDGTRNPFKCICDAVVNNRWICVESGISTGKTFFGACLTLWFLECFEDALVITVAPKADQLRLNIWKEIGRVYPNFGLGELLTQQLRMEPPRDNWTAIAFVAGVGAEEVGRSATRAQGFHAEHMLILFEETPGIHQAVMAAFRNTSVAPHNLIVAFGNPDHELDNLHTFGKLSRVVNVRISAFDHPNVVLDDPSFVAGATSRLGLQDLKESYHGEENPFYQSRARGISPSGSPDSLIRVEWCTDARNRQREVAQFDGESALGVDVANSVAGDKAALALGKGIHLLRVDSFQCPSSNKLGDRVAQLMMDEQIVEDRVGVDSIGVGAGTYNQLIEAYGFKVNPLNSGTVVTRGVEKFNSLRAQMWWQMREDLRLSRITLPDDPELFADLVSPKWERRDTVLVVEAKEEIKKRLGRSPDKGDAAVYWNWVRARREADSLAFPRFKMDRHRVATSFKGSFPVYVSVQLDRDPSIWLISQHQNGRLAVLREIVDYGSDLWTMCGKTRNALAEVVGAEHLIHPTVFFGMRERGDLSTASAWEIVRQEFKEWTVDFRVKMKHSEVDVRHSVNAILEGAGGVALEIDPSAIELLRDLETVSVDRFEASGSESKASASSCLGYVVNQEFPVKPQPIGRQL